MKLSTIFKLAAVVALCVAGYVDAHAQTVINDGSLGSNSALTGNCTGLSIESCDYYEGATGIGSDATIISHWGSGEGTIFIGSKSSYVHDGSCADCAIGSVLGKSSYVHDGSSLGNQSYDSSRGIRIGPIDHTQSDAVIAAYQKQLARHAATANTLIEDNAEILSPSCLVEVETLQRTLRNAYSSTGGQLPLNEPPFNRHSPEFRGYVAALVDQSRRTSGVIESKVARNCWDPDATSFYRGEEVDTIHTEIGRWAH